MKLTTGQASIGTAVFGVLLYPEGPELAPPGPPESFGMREMRETAGKDAVGRIIDAGTGRQKGNPGLILRTALGRALVVCAGFNLVAVAVLGGYDHRFWFVHLIAHDAFKPQQLLVAALVIALILRPHLVNNPAGPAEGVYAKRRLAFLLAVPVILYLPSVGINFEHHDWNHVHITGAIRGIKPLLALFTHAQGDGFYRPLGFVSLWIDNLIFGPQAWGYHLQSIGLHLLNVVLAYRLFRRLNINPRTSSWAAALVAIASVFAEPVIWPAARFDLLATTFVMAALGSSLDYLRDPNGGKTRLAGAAGFTTLGILSKEIAYAVPVIVLYLIATAPVWELRRPSLRRTIRLVAALSAPCLVGVAVRFAMYGGLGGYPGQSRPLWLPSLRGVNALVVRVFSVPPLALNSSVRLGFPGIAALVLFAACCVLIVLLSSGRLDRKSYAIGGLALVSALPVMTVAGWMGASMLHSRYLYWPAVWVALLLVHMIEMCRVPRLVLTMLLLANLSAATSNLLVYRDARTWAESVAVRIGRDIRNRPDVRAVYLVGIPDSANGVLFFAEQVLTLVRKESQGRAVSLIPAAAADRLPPEHALIYRWDSRLRDVR